MKRLPLVLLLLARVWAQSDPAVEVGVEQRVRNENWNNISDWSDSTNDQRNQVRYRTRLWTKIPVSDNFEFVVGLNQESNVINGRANRFDEIVFETAYVDVKRLFHKSLSLRVGRQNLMKGEGFLLLEGNPWDGSRTIYQNAAVLTYTRKKSTLDFIGILDPAYDSQLPRIHDQHRMLQEWDDSALGAYYTNNDFKNTTIEAYYVYNKEVYDVRAKSNFQFQPDRHNHTTGGRVTRLLGAGYTAVGEFAVQRGAKHGGVETAGWGGYGYLKKTLDVRTKPYLQAGYWGMSGDNPATAGRDEGWDPLFSRWPKWSELYIYSQVSERGVAYWSNSSIWQAEVGLAPVKRLDARVTYYHMGAYQPFAPGSAKVYAAGTDRGDQIQARLGLTLSKDLTGHVLYERHAPGDFYQGRNAGYFMRFELVWQHRWRHAGALL
jgi:hypothetical protein